MTAIKRVSTVFFLFVLLSYFISAEESEISGLYESVEHNEPLRLAVELSSKGSHQFRIYYRDELRFEFSLNPRKDKRYNVDAEGEELTFDFEGPSCGVYSGDEFIRLKRRTGPPEDITGIYTLEEGSYGYMLLEVNKKNGKYLMAFEYWEVETKAEEYYRDNTDIDAKTDYGEIIGFSFFDKDMELGQKVGGRPGFIMVPEYGELIVFAEIQSAEVSAFSPYEKRWKPVMPDFAVRDTKAGAFKEAFHVPLPASDRMRIEDINLSVPKTFTPQGGAVHSLSPDGSKILSYSPIKIRVYDTKSGRESSVFQFSRAIFDPVSLSWSPDGRAVVFTENFFVYMHEPDLHLLDFPAKEHRILTEDGTERLPFGSAEEYTGKHDVTPVWLPDGETILFQRLERTEGYNAVFCTIPQKGGEPTVTSETLSTLPSIVNILAHYRSGSIYYTYMPGHKSNRLGGIWRILPGNTESDLIYRNTNNQGRFSVLADISFSEEILLIVFPEAFTAGGEETEPFILYDVDSGRSNALPSSAGSDDGLRRRYSNAVFSPDGSKILYSFTEDDTPGAAIAVIAVNSLELDEEKVLYRSDDPSLGRHSISNYSKPIGLDWANDDTILASLDNGKQALIFKILTDN